MVLSRFLVLLTLVFPCTLASYKISDAGGLERRFDGIGGLSGGGATSKLLVNYPEPQRSQILDYLFKPNFGASLHILKVEIGGDAQSTDGTESSHMHESWDLNYERGYEWWLMTEAKRRNPDILLYGLPWAFPGWLGHGTDSPYHNPVQTANYILKWIQGAKSRYNLTMNYIGIWNERKYNITYIKTLRSVLDNNGFSNIQIVAPDGGWSIAKDIEKDPSLAAAVDVIGSHYPGTFASQDALNTKKQLWASEDYSTFNDNVGGGCWARILNQNYVNGYMTSTISWNLIASYYPNLPYNRDGLMTAVEPWSGHYEVESPIWVSDVHYLGIWGAGIHSISLPRLTAHTTQFTEPGWKYLKHGSGVGKLVNGGSYVALTNPNVSQLTIIIETMQYNHSTCIRPPLKPYIVTPQVATFTLEGSFASAITQLMVRYTKLSFNATPSVFFEKRANIQVVNDVFSIALGVDEIYTLTNADASKKGDFPMSPPSEIFPLPYSDDFNKYTEHAEPDNFAQQTGVYEVLGTEEGQGFIRQMLIHEPVYWCAADKGNVSISVIGDFNWTDIYAEVDIRVQGINATNNGTFLAARVDRGGCHAFLAKGIFFFIDQQRMSFTIYNDIARTTVLATGPASIKDAWNTLGLLVQGNFIVGFLNGEVLFQTNAPKSPTNGFVALGTGSYGYADFDNFSIKSHNDGSKIMRNLMKRPKDKNVLYFEPYE